MNTSTTTSTSAELATIAATTRSYIAAMGTAGWLGTMSEHTSRAYRSDVDQFSAWLSVRGLSADDVTPGVTTAWLSDMAAAGLAAATRARKLSAVKSFYRYARAERATIIDPAPFTSPKVQRDEATGSIDTNQARAVWQATEGKPRRRVLVAVMLFCGLRVSEAIGLQVADVQDQQGARVLRVMGKGSKPRTAVLPAVAVQAITEWLAVRGDQEGPLLSTRSGAAMDTRAAHREIRALGESVGIAGLHPHTLRHTFATAAVDSGVEVLRLATALGHASPTTTMRYVRGRDVITNSPVHAVAAAILARTA